MPLIVLHPVIPTSVITIIDNERISFFIGPVDAKIEMVWLLFFLKKLTRMFHTDRDEEAAKADGVRQASILM